MWKQDTKDLYYDLLYNTAGKMMVRVSDDIGNRVMIEREHSANAIMNPLLLARCLSGCSCHPRHPCCLLEQQALGLEEAEHL